MGFPHLEKLAVVAEVTEERQVRPVVQGYNRTGTLWRGSEIDTEYHVKTPKVRPINYRNSPAGDSEEISPDLMVLSGKPDAGKANLPW
jgi:hypothetical protein